MSKTLESNLLDRFEEELEEIKKRYSIEEAFRNVLENTTIEHGGASLEREAPNKEPISEWFDDN